MENLSLQIINTALLPAYMKQVPKGLQEAYDALKDAELSTVSFSFYTSVSVMASSKIEGEPLDIDSYIKHKMLNIEYLEDVVQKPNDLYQAYIFAQKNELTKENFNQTHALLSAHLLPEHKRGVCRTGNMVVMEHKTFRIQYEAAPGSKVRTLLDKLWSDIEKLKVQDLSIEEVFYYASFIHIAFVNIHPFEDGNGRVGRLLEKWFIAHKLGEKAWYVQSELYYYRHINDYYLNLNRLGLFYEQLDYSKSMPFLLMLPQAVIQKQIGWN